MAEAIWRSDQGDPQEHDIHAMLKDARKKIMITNPASKAIRHINRILEVDWRRFLA